VTGREEEPGVWRVASATWHPAALPLIRPPARRCFPGVIWSTPTAPGRRYRARGIQEGPSVSPRIVVRGVVASFPLLLVAALAANAASIRYSWTGRVEPAVGAENPWGLTGDGSAVTDTDGVPFLVEAFVDEAAVDEDGTLNPDYAEFATEATLLIDGRKAGLDSPVLSFSNDAFEGLFDSVGFAADAEVLGATLYFAADVRLPATSFDLASPPAPDPPPLFAESPPIQFGGFGLPDLLTMPANEPVTAVLVPWAAFPPATAVEWSSATAGSAGDVEVTIAWLNEPSFPSTGFADLSGPAFQAAPFYSLTSSLSYPTGSAWTVTFSEPVATLLLYTGFWRGSGGGPDPVTYHFDVPFSIRSGLEGATVLGNLGGLILSLPGAGFHDGVVQIAGPLTSLTVTPNTEVAAQQLMALAVVPLQQGLPVDWSAPTAGSAGVVGVTMADLGASASLQAGDLSGSDFAAAPLSAAEELLEYDTGADWTATLSEPVEGLLVYTKFWRGSDAGVDPVTYRFDSPFTILSGLREARVSEDGTLLTLPAAGFHDGIVFVPGPLESLSVEGDEPTDVAQNMTFAVVGAVPEPGAAGAVLTSWLVLLALRRRA
jgi:hypothetical protein